MAEIRVERVPRRRLGWLWLVLIVLALAVVWYLWSTGVIGGAKTTTAPDTTRTGSIERAATMHAMQNAGPPRLARAA